MALPEFQEGLADLQKAYLYSKKKQEEEATYQASLRPEKKQKTLNEKKFSPNVICDVIVGETP